MTRGHAIVYMSLWGSLVVVALALAVYRRRELLPAPRAYLMSLLTPWKLLVLAPALVFFVLAAPYTGDPTWDWKDGGLMSVLTYLTAPWAVGTLARSRATLARRPSRTQVFVAVIAWLSSASWSYDGYLFLRDGRYPLSWAVNIPASTALYAAAGMLFSLVHVKERGVVFDFMTDEWYRTPGTGFGKVAAAALVLILGVALAMSPFLLEVLRSMR